MDNNKYQLWRLPEIARKYLSGVRVAFPGTIQQMEVMLKLLEENRKEIHTFLDIGCGDGMIGATLLDKYPDSKGVFLDFSEEMLEAAVHKLEGSRHRTEFVHFDYGDNGWIEKVSCYKPYDVVVSGFSIHHQTDEKKKEIYKQIY